MCCAEIPWKAIVRYADVPTNPHQLAEFEEQIRRAYTVPSIYEPIGYGPNGAKVCATFVKPKLSPQDLDFLNDTGRALFEPYVP